MCIRNCQRQTTIDHALTISFLQRIGLSHFDRLIGIWSFVYPANDSLSFNKLADKNNVHLKKNARITKQSGNS